MRNSTLMMKAAALVTVLLAGTAAAQAETVMQQCGQQYQAAKAAGTLNGMTWNQFRTDCSAKLKAQPASATEAAPATPAAATTPAVAPAPAPAATAPEPTTAQGTTPATGGRAAFVARERQCGSEWRANKTTLIAQTPGLTWPKYLSACNKRLKASAK